MNKQILLLALLLGLPLSSRAEPSCEKQVSSYQGFIRCAEEQSPEVQRATLELERAKANIQASGQWQNPELSAESYSGTVASEKSSETEIALGVPIDLGGKISSRRAVAEGGAAQAEAILLQARLRARSSLQLKLHRLRQLLHEQEVVEESISTFTKLISQYAKRPGLSPEQEISAAVFRMAKSEYDLKKVEVLDELASLNSYFRVAAGVSAESIKSILPQSPKTWPKLSPTYSPGKSLRSKLLQADVAVSQAEVSLARSEAWPTLTLGPSVKLQTEGGRSDQLYGFNVSLPLPIFSLNSGGKAAALAGAKLSEASRKFGMLEEEREREELIQSYQQSVAVLGSTLSHQDIEKKHSEVERLFLRGVVPSSLVIEAHRTFVELEKSRNEREQKALEALTKIYAIDGESAEIL